MLKIRNLLVIKYNFQKHILGVYIKEVYSLLRGGGAENIAIFVTNIEIMKIFSFEKKINIRGKMSLIYISCNSFGMWI